MRIDKIYTKRIYRFDTDFRQISDIQSALFFSVSIHHEVCKYLNVYAMQHQFMRKSKRILHEYSKKTS